MALAACNLQISTKAEARDQWHRRYTLAHGGTLEIRNTNGIIRLDAGDGPAIDVTADRVVQAATDQAAKEALAAFEIAETVAPDRVTLDSTTRNSGGNLFLNLNRRVEYHVTLPRDTNVRLETTNGDINLGGLHLTGTFRAETTNGRIRATGLENTVEAGTTNGTISLEIARLGENGVSCETTNGTVELAVPADVNARLSARVTNGAIRTDGLALNVSEQSRRRLDATLGSGGPPIKLETTNGAIRVSAAK